MEPTLSHDSLMMHKLRADRYKKDLEIGQRKYDHLDWANKETSRKLYEVNQIGRQLAGLLGFEGITEAYASISRGMHDCDQTRANKQSHRIQTLEKQLAEQREVDSSLQRELEGAMEENEDLRARLRLAASEPTHPDNSVISPLHSALADLRERYDALLKAKEDAATAYKKDYRQWREFK
ncbi:hypothetical protein FIBSPDRAFT_1055367, partial [Athelia psychrophila]